MGLRKVKWCSETHSVLIILVVDASCYKEYNSNDSSIFH